jgi:MFS family permease
MQTTAQAYLAFEMTKSPAFLGWLAFANGAPSWALMLVAGAVVDRFSRRRVLIYSQVFMMILAVIMVALTYFQLLLPWHLLVLSALQGAANSFDAPARQSLASELVDRKDLTNAFALNATLFNTGATIGPALAGIIYVLYGPVWCFGINALSFVAVLVALFKIQSQGAVKHSLQGSLLGQMKEGVDYVKNHPIIGALVAMAAALSLFGVSVVTIFPAWAVEQLHGDARVAGYLQASRGVGAVVAAVTVAYFASTLARGRLINASAGLLPLALLGFSFAKTLPLSVCFVALLGAAQIMTLNLSNSILHSEVEDRLRGRVASIFSLTFFGLLPVGGLIIGQLAERFSEPTAVLVSAVTFLTMTIGIYSRYGQVLKLQR